MQGSMNQAGLGPALWWTDQDEAGDVDMEGTET